MKNLLILFSLIFVLVITGWSIPEGGAQNNTLQGTITAIEQSIGKSDAQGLSKYFDTYVEVTINDVETTYPKTQAAFVLKEFFMNNKLQSFHILHQGSSANTYYAVGEYNSSQGKFDANLFLKKIGGAYFIEQIRFEKEK